MAYLRESRSVTLTTAVATVLDSIEISHFDKFAMSFKNVDGSAVVTTQVHLSLGDPHNTTASTLDYVSANTAIIAFPSALGTAGTVVHTSAINNVWNFARIIAHTTASEGATFKLGISGHRRV
jgi:hypothetical protein